MRNQIFGECGGTTGKWSVKDLGVKPGNWPADFPAPNPTAHLTGAGRHMSIPSPKAFIRRAAALPMGLLDRADAAMDKRFARADSALDCLIVDVRSRATVAARGAARATNSLDHALDCRLKESDSHATARAARISTAAGRIRSVAASLEIHSDTNLNRSLYAVDRVSESATRVAIATMNSSVVLTQLADSKVASGFNRLDVRVINMTNRMYRQQAKIRSFAGQAIDHIDQRIEADLLRADTHLDRRLDQATMATISTTNLVNAKALAFERAVDFGIARVDSKITAGQASGIVAVSAVSSGLIKIDQEITGSLTRIDQRLETRFSKVTHRCSQLTDIATKGLAITDAKVENSMAAFDLRVASVVNTLATATVGVSNFSVGQVNSADKALTKGISQIDARSEFLVAFTSSRSKDQASQGRTSMHRIATALTLVLGTLGAATGASLSSASQEPAEVDVTLKYESSAAKDAVTQYLSVRDSFQALQASRSRTIKTLEQEIASAKVRASQASLDGDAIIDIANNYGGVPYARGGTTPRGFDCSGYTSYVFAQLGIDLPRTSYEQKAWADSVSVKDRKVGDLMFWQGGGIDHVAIYAGNGKMWDSPRPGRRVGKVSIWGTPTYGRVPASAINGPALREIEVKTAELKELKRSTPQLPITIDERNLVQD